MEKHDIVSLLDKIQHLGIQLIKKIQLGYYDIDIHDYVSFATTQYTRGNIINLQFNSYNFKDTFYNCLNDSITMKHNRLKDSMTMKHALM